MKEPEDISKGDRELRTYTRARENLVNNRTQMNNRIHQHLNLSVSNYLQFFRMPFEKSGRYLKSLLEVKNMIKSQE